MVHDGISQFFVESHLLGMYFSYINCMSQKCCPFLYTALLFKKKVKTHIEKTVVLKTLGHVYYENISSVSEQYFRAPLARRKTN